MALLEIEKGHLYNKAPKFISNHYGILYRQTDLFALYSYEIINLIENKNDNNKLIPTKR